MLDVITLRAAAAAEWTSSAAIRAEFGSVEALAAYREATARGLVTVRTGGVVRSAPRQAGADRAMAHGAAAAGNIDLEKPLTLRSGNTRLQLASAVALSVGAGANLPAKFNGIAYSGGYVPDYGVVIDMATTTHKPRMPLLDSHSRAAIVGVIEQASTERGRLAVSGVLLSDMAGSAAERIASLAQRGVPFEMSVGLYAFTREAVPAGKSVIVNGRTFAGPVNVLRNGQVREVSIVTLGADASTSVGFH